MGTKLELTMQDIQVGGTYKAVSNCTASICLIAQVINMHIAWSIQPG